MAYPVSLIILVVGHHQASRQSIQDILQQAGFRVQGSGATAAELELAAARQNVQLIVSVDLPESEGRELFAGLAPSSAAGAPPVLYLYGCQAEAGPELDGTRTFQPAELLANIRALLRIHHAEEEASAHLRQTIHLDEISTHLSHQERDLPATLHEVLSAIMELQQASMGTLLLFNEERRELFPTISIGMPEEVLRGVGRVPAGVGASGMAAAEHRSVVIEDVRTEPAYIYYQNLAETTGYRAVYSVPLLTRKEGVLGVITTCWAQPHRPSPWEIHLVELYARHAANAIENARLYERLQEEDRNKDEFLAMLAHELRNPLAPILNAAHVMRLHAPNNDTLLWAISMVERQTRHLTHLVDDLLDVSRITRGKIELHRELVTLRGVLQNVAESSRPVIADRGHMFVLELPEETIWLDADPMRLEQIFNNLLHNAAKYTPRGGRITFSAEREPPTPDFPRGSAAVRVCDSGIGIAPEMLRRVFDVFSQAERTLDRAEGGLGLGLTLVRRLSEMHGGTVEARSEGLGCGSEFIVRLPLVPLSPETFEAHPRDEHQDELDALFQGGRGQGHRVLVVDDQVDTAQSLAELLEIWGHEVRVGYDGASAVELAADFNPEVVLLDIGLPLLNGYEVALRLREMAGNMMTLVAMTGYGQDEDRRRALEAGFDLHMTKPVDLNVLRDLLNSTSRI